jgi:hypothetical protein
MDVGDWLRSLGLQRYEAAFRENEIDETVLPRPNAIQRTSDLPPDFRTTDSCWAPPLGLPSRAGGFGRTFWNLFSLGRIIVLR